MAIAGYPSRDTSRKPLVLSLTIGVVLMLVGVSAFLIRAHSSHAPKVAVSAPKESVPLQVQVEQMGNGLINVRWNPQSTFISEARNGRLVITGRDQQPQMLSLEAQQLTTGQLNYQSSAEWLQFQLEIVDKAGKVSGESVVTLSSKPPLVVTSLTPPQVANSQSPARKVESIPTPNRNADALQPAKTMEAPPNRPLAPRAFTPPPSSSSRDGQVPAISFDQPPMIASNPTLPSTLVPYATLNNLPAPLVNQPPMTKQIRVGGSVQAASLIRKVAPHYPPIAMSAHLEETVRFTALIGKDGTVRNLQRISGSQVFLEAATEAVKQWIYRPTLLNGDPVEVITQIDVNFTLKR
jgi:protein TonB